MQIRWLVGDTSTNDQQVQNEEITFALGQEPDIYNAAALVADGIAAKYARRVDKSVGDLSLADSQKQTHYAGLALRFRAQAGRRSATIYAGGISVSDKQTTEADSDRVVPQFRMGMTDNPNVATDSTGST